MGSACAKSESVGIRGSGAAKQKSRGGGGRGQGVMTQVDGVDFEAHNDKVDRGLEKKRFECETIWCEKDWKRRRRKKVDCCVSLQFDSTWFVIFLSLGLSFLQMDRLSFELQNNIYHRHRNVQ